MAGRWSTLSRGTRIGAIVGVAVILPLVPFLMYAGLAVMNATVGCSQQWAGAAIAELAGLTAFVLYLFLVFGIPAVLGGLIGALLGSAK